MDWTKIGTSMIPLVLGALWWVISSIQATNAEISHLKANMMMLIDPNGRIIPSPGNALERQALREDLMRSIHDMQVRIKLLEARENDRRK
jgi:hypothetical protein